MRYFLASSLCFVSDIVTKYVDLKGKKVACIRNAANQWGGADAFRNQRDKDFFEKEGAEVVSLDIEHLSPNEILSILASADILFVGGGDTKLLAEQMKEAGLMQSLPSILKKGLIYMGTSAGAMIASKTLYYRHEDQTHIHGIGLLDTNIIPHRGQPGHRDYQLSQFPDLYTYTQPSILLSDIDVIVGTGTDWSLERSQEWTLESVFALAAQQEG